MNIAVCEDENASAQYEKSLLQEWAQKRNLQINVNYFTSAENFLFNHQDEKIVYDLMILDIQMGKMTGVDLAKNLRKNGFNGSLVFLTGVKDFALEGYEVGAVRYLLKPVKSEQFFEVLDLVHADCVKKQNDFFLLQTGSEIQKIPYEDIIYIEADGHYVSLKTSSFQKEWKAAFGKLTEDFESRNFFCLRRGLLVNILHIKRISRTECILDNGEALPVSRNNYEGLNQAFISFYRNNLI